MFNGSQIRLAREALGLSQQSMHEETKLSPITLRRVESNLMGCSSGTIHKVMKALEDRGVRFVWGGTGKSDRLIMPDGRVIHEDGTIWVPGADNGDVTPKAMRKVKPPRPRTWEDRIVRVPGGYRILPKDPDES